MNRNLTSVQKPFFLVGLFHKFQLVPLEPFLASQATEMISFAFICDFEFCSILVKHHPTDWVPIHYLIPNLDEGLCF